MIRSAHRPRLVALFRYVVLAGLVTALLPAPAVAHADLVESSPRANASLLESPEQLRLVFSEPIDPDLAYVDVLDASQRRVDGVGAPAILDPGDTILLDLPALDPGTYTVTYQVISAVDGHATTGIFAFVVDPAGTEAPPPLPPESASPSVDGWTVAGRWLGLGGALVALGSMAVWWRSRSALGTGTASRPPWLLVGVAALVGFAGLAAYLSLAARPILAAAPERAGGWFLDFAAPFGTTPFAAAMRLSLAGLLVTAIVAGIAAALGGSARMGRLQGPLASAAGAATAAALAGMSLAAHAAAAGGPAFAALDWAHLVAVAAWLGGLPAIFVLARRSDAASGARDLLRRHGGLALLAAPVVALTGIANSPLVLGESRELVGSGYGNLLLAKGALLGVAAGIGAVNFLVLRGRGRAAITALVAGELVVAAIAVGVAAAMVTIQPAAARGPAPTAAPVTPSHLFGTAGPASVHATVNLPMPGMQSYQVTIRDAETGIPREDVQRVFLEFQPPPGAAATTTERAELSSDPTLPGLYAGTGAYLSVEGAWTVEVVVRRAGALDESVGFTVPVRQPSPPRLVPPPDTGVGVPAPIGLLWTVLPTGPVGWLPAAAAIVGVLTMTLVVRRRSPALNVVRAALLAVVVITMLGAGSRALVATANAPPPDALAEHARPDGLVGSVEDGAALYRANCASCHGADGLGDGPVRTLPPAGDLREAVGGMTSAELSYRIANGYAGTAMPAFAATLTEGERWNLVTYLEDRWR
ncbi:MAG TPA: copper resistance protein CopC [Candidatus Limnocylindrales bacterium]|nr:copper resistance protein CopC [Candidatus Limnocylindrales bacterium]